MASLPKQPMNTAPPFKPRADHLPLSGDILEMVTSHIGAGLAVISPNFTVLWTNGVLEEIYGDTVGKICYRTYQQQETVCPWCGVREVFEQNRERVVKEVASRDKNGDPIDLEIIATPIRDTQGNITAALELVLPITQRKQKEKALAELLAFSHNLASTVDLNNLYRKVTSLSKELLDFDFSTLMLMTDDQNGLVIRDTLGFAEQTIGHYALVKGQGLSTHVVLAKKPAVVADFQQETRFEVPSLVVEKNIRSALCVPMMLGEEVFGVLIGHTLQPRIFSEEAIGIYQSFANQAAVAIKNAMHMHSLHASEKKFRALFDSTNDAILIYSLDCRLLEVNHATCERLGYSREELLALPLTQLVAPPYASLAKELEQLQKNGTGIFESAHRKKDGSILPIEQSCSLIDYDTQTAVLCVSRDISERKRLDEERLRTQKLESLGVLAGGIAHDFNNLLTGILGNLSLVKASLPETGMVAERLTETEKATLRARDLTQQLLTFAKGGAPIKTEASLAGLIQDAAGFAVRGTKAVCEYDCADDLWLAEVDTGQLGQVLQNLVINAVHAMPEGGTIRLAAKNLTVNPGELPLAPGKYVLITIRDHGLGIPPEHLAKIFDPYFTTKQSGSGLGLAVVYSIIASHAGHITVESEQGKGPVFSIYLPSAGKSHGGVEKPAETVAPLRKGQGKILVMDDEELIRNVSTAMLGQLGYEAHAANDGEEAITRYLQAKKDGQPFDLLIMDLTVPGGMGGKEALGHLRQLDPQVKAVVSSGYANDPIMANFSEYGFCGVAPKPFSLQDMSKLLQMILNS
ncbi:MAG: PAS domain S-box protein [Desulfurivibrionaceae bacterium]|jgi:PAS domain S-box-containing protein